MIAHLIARRQVAPGEGLLTAALGRWERQLAVETIGRWLIRGAIGGLAIAIAVLLVGWVVPMPESELRPWALELATIPLLAAAMVALWPMGHVRRAAELDARLRFGDRLATAWAYRNSDKPIVRLQREDAIARLGRRSPRTDLRWRPRRVEVWALGATALLATLLLFTTSPQQAVLDQQAAEQVSVQQAAQRLDALRQQALEAPSLTPEQARELDELLQQAQAELNRSRTQQEATMILARTQDQLTRQFGDPNADLRDEALAAMSETLAAEPQTQALADALQQENGQAASDAVGQLAGRADQLSDIERQALSRALQRAANVGRSDPRSASALRDAAQALASGNPADASAALARADEALREAIRASQAQASLNATQQRLRDLQAQLASGQPLRADQPGAQYAQGAAANAGLGAANAAGTPVAVDASGGTPTARDPSAGQGGGAGVGAAGDATQGYGTTTGPAAENVFVPGRASNGPADQDLTGQPFTVRGAARPYRDVLNQYAQSSRDYVDRPDISPAVRDLVKRYFQELEQGQ
jgi:hypothetical protein